MRKAQPNERPTVLDEADSIVNGQRRADYGGPLESFTDIAKGWSMVLGVEVTAEQVGLCMIQLKVARAKNGGFHRDSFVDIAGYAQCMEFIADAREAGKLGLPSWAHAEAHLGRRCQARPNGTWEIVESTRDHLVGTLCGLKHDNEDKKETVE